MPLHRISEIEGGGMLGTWEVTETAGMMLEEISLTENERLRFGRFNTTQRQKQWLSYRMLLMHMLGTGQPPDIYYDNFGKPHLIYYDYFISVSHSGAYTAAIAHPGLRAGIDIEVMRENILRIAPRFMSQQQLRSLGSDDLVQKLHILWGAKESVYKAFGRKELDFREDIHVGTTFTPSNGCLQASIQRAELLMHFRVDYEKMGEYMLVYAVESEIGDKRPFHGVV
jgi:phosphopantetheinyl transferase